jgi:putative nucleotidyltransferase-like protein
LVQQSQAISKSKYRQFLSRSDMTHNLLTRAFASRESLGTLDVADWNHLLPAARRAGLLSGFEALLAEHGLTDEVPEAVRVHLQSAKLIAENERRVMLWELNRIERVLVGIDTPIVLLKGGAYILTDLPVARGRLSTDLDLLVSKDRLSEVEERLLRHGWQHTKLDEYDQYYYRHWSHELPPLQHRDRSTILDVHHTILPPTGRLRPDAEKLIAASVPLKGTIFRVLAPPDMVLHSAAHAFQDGDLTRGLRDLVDIDGLLHHFSQKKAFWNELVSRADELDMRRPLYYALRYSQRYLQTEIPQDLLNRSERWRPLWPASFMMDVIVDHAITAGPWRKDLCLKLSRQLLYIRSHWLRMPPWLLAKHLLRQSLRRLSGKKQRD